MGLFDSIFGSEPEARTDKHSVMTPDQEQLFNQMIRDFLLQPKTLSAATTPYTGTMAAPLSKLQGMSLEALEQQVLQQATGGAGNDVARTALEGMIRSGGSPVNFDEAFTKGVQDPLLYDFSNEILPRLQSTFSGNAAFGSDKLKQQEILTRNLMDTLAGKRAEFAYKSQGDALARVLQASGMLPALGAADQALLLQGLQAGAVPQQTNQASLTAAYNEFLRQQQARQDDVKAMLAALGIKAFENVTTVTPGSDGLLGGVSKGIGMLAGKKFLGL